MLESRIELEDHDGYRFQAILTDQPDTDIAILERRHRQRARVEERVRDDKDTGLAKLPFKEFALNEAWLEIVMLAHDLIVWAQALLPDGELQKVEPNGCATDSYTSPAGSRVPRTARQAPPPGHLALGGRARCRVRATQSPPNRRLTTPRWQRPAALPAPRA